jgi:2-C-methyl-D-erythritol 2,4-cyclodiphosphate synthase
VYGNYGILRNRVNVSHKNAVEVWSMLSDEYRVGFGHDTHRTIHGRRLMLGGVQIPDVDFGLDGHSDADVLLHAVTDALLGGTGLGDIGEWFSDQDHRWKDADSAELLAQVSTSIRNKGWRICNLDCTIHAERPRLLSWKPLIRERLSEILHVESSRINVKAKSGERVGPVGNGEAIMADAVVLLQREH